MSNPAIAPCSVEDEIEAPYDRTVHRQLAMQETLRKIGFESNEILMAWNMGPRTLVKDREKEFSISYPGAVLHSEDEIEHFREWLEESNRWHNELSDSDRNAICDRHVPEPLVQVVIVALKAKGFRLRNLEH